MTSISYQEALDYLYSFIDYSVERTFRYSPEVFELARVRDVLSRLDDPHTRYPSVLIAGTKGKGSVAAFVDSSLRAAGFRTGLYSSPHLRRFTERIQIDGEEISEEEVVRLVELIKPHVAQVPDLTTYELITVMGLLEFSERNVDFAVVEVGLGGRLDATNVVTPVTSVITSISYDHMHLLGDSLSDIAGEKAGIIKSGIPVVSAPQQHEVEGVFAEVANARDARLIMVGRDWLFSPGRHSLENQSLYIWSDNEQTMMDTYVNSAGAEEWVPPRFEISLLGYHQVMNAATAYAALNEISQAGYSVTPADIREGFRSAVWPGRFNRDSALKLRIALDDYFPGQLVTLVFGASEDKDIAGMFAELMPRVTKVIVSQAFHPRAADTETLGKIARTYGHAVETITPVADAFISAIENVGIEGVVLVAGSIFVAGEALEAWEEYPIERLSSGKHNE
jgi:dihydrofolate synthase/folylpolyglutamate synthase